MCFIVFVLVLDIPNIPTMYIGRCMQDCPLLAFTCLPILLLVHITSSGQFPTANIAWLHLERKISIHFEPVVWRERSKERLRYSYSQKIFPIQWGAVRSYLEFPNHLIEFTSVSFERVVFQREIIELYKIPMCACAISWCSCMPFLMLMKMDRSALVDSQLLVHFMRLCFLYILW